MINILIIVLSIVFTSNAYAVAPIINTVTQDQTASFGDSYSQSIILSQGDGDIVYLKEFGPDDVSVDSETGTLTWSIPSSGMLTETFYLGVRVWNADGTDTEVWKLKVGGGSYVYIDPDLTTGNNDGTSWTDAYQSMTGMSSVSSGDTVVIADGTYTGSAERIYNDNGGRGTVPASGSASAYTTVIADTPGGVEFDGESTYQPIRMYGDYSPRNGGSPGNFDISYIAFKGLIGGNSSSSGSISISQAENLKFVYCGGHDQAEDSGSIINIQKSYRILIESCYVWGHGREAVAAFLSDYIIFRRCVARIDRVNEYEPLGGFVHYGNHDGLTQNCIVIDSNQTDYWEDHSYLAGWFCNDCGNYCGYDYGQIQNIKVYNSLSLNNYGKISASTRTDNETYRAYAEAPEYYNNVFWGLSAWYGNGSHTGNPNSANVNHSDSVWHGNTFADFDSPVAAVDNAMFLNGYNNNDTGDSYVNNIIYRFDDYGGTSYDGGVFFEVEEADYNAIYETGTINVSGSTVTNTITDQPTFTYILYPDNTAFATAGQSSDQVGAVLTKMHGKSGTMWGDTGYNVEQSADMWPLPGENLFKTKMSAYTYDSGNLTGDRGFCASDTPIGDTPTGDITLTSYVWEYLGNAIPSDIYGGSASGSGASPFKLSGGGPLLFSGGNFLQVSE